MKTLTYFFVLLMMFLTSGTLAAQDSIATDKEQFLELKKELNAAIDTYDRPEVARIGYAMERFFEHPEIKKYAHYYAGYAWYRMYSLPAEDGSEPMKSSWTGASISWKKLWKSILTLLKPMLF